MLLALGGIIFFFKFGEFEAMKKGKDGYPGYVIEEYTLEGSVRHFLVADTREKQEKGLMFYRSLEGVDGMIFKFPSSNYQVFWNKNTYMDLKLHWINKGQVIGTSELPSIEKSKDIVTVTSPAEADTVIEIPH